jgi:hypothetical protein
MTSEKEKERERANYVYTGTNISNLLPKYSYVSVTNLYIKGKVKFTLEQARKAQSWSRGIALLFL